MTFADWVCKVEGKERHKPFFNPAYRVSRFRARAPSISHSSIRLVLDGNNRAVIDAFRWARTWAPDGQPGSAYWDEVYEGSRLLTGEVRNFLRWCLTQPEEIQ